MFVKNNTINIDFESMYIINVQKNLKSVRHNSLDEYLKTSRYNLFLYNTLIEEYNALDNNYIKKDNDNNTSLYIYKYIDITKKNSLQEKLLSLLLNQRRIFYTFNNYIKIIHKEYKNIDLQKYYEEKQQDSNINIISRNISELRALFKIKKNNNMNDNASIKSVKSVRSVKSVKSVKSIDSTDSGSKKKFVVNRSERSDSKDSNSLTESKKKKFTLFKKTSISTEESN
jgi:hypothetical protein